MRTTTRRLSALLVLLAALWAAAVGSAATPVNTGVVTITTRLGYQGAAAAATGMVITSSGEVLTNNHVISGSTAIRVRIPQTGRSYAARVVGYDVRDDVALLQLQGATGLKTVSVRTAKAAVGDKVRAVGNAGGTGSLQVVSGSITGTGRAITASDDQGGSERLIGLLETDAAVVAGDSGGPLLDASGNVVGMVTAASSDGGFRFENARASDAYAIPIGKALTIAHAIENGESSAAVHIGPTAFLGVQVGPSDTGSGAVIASVVRGGPADTAGLGPGDVITSVAGRAISSPAALSATVLAKKPGQAVSVRYLDETGTHTVTVRLGTGPPR